MFRSIVDGLMKALVTGSVIGCCILGPLWMLAFLMGL